MNETKEKMSREEQELMVERLKVNERPLGMLSREEKVRFFACTLHCRGGEVLKCEPGRKATWVDWVDSEDTVTDGYCDALLQGGYIEVQESGLPYLKKPDGDWEFRKAETKPEPRYLECEIREVGMKWCVYMKKHPWSKVSKIWWLPLSEAADVVGFGGVEFDDKNGWYNATSYLDRWNEGKPVIPRKARFMIGGAE